MNFKISAIKSIASIILGIIIGFFLGFNYPGGCIGQCPKDMLIFYSAIYSVVFIGLVYVVWSLIQKK